MRRYLATAAVIALGAAMTASADDAPAAAADVPLVVEAGRFAVYQGDVAKLEASPFASLEDIDAGLETVASYNPDKLSRAWMAYSALVAAQSLEFADGVRQTVDAYGRDAVVAGLRNDPAWAGQIVGADAARAAVLAAADHDVSRLSAVSATVKQQAYSLQSQDWAKVRTGASSARLARLAEVSPRSAPPELLTAIAAPSSLVIEPGRRNKKMEREAAAASAAFWGAFPLAAAPAESEAPAPVVDLTNPVRKNVLDQVATLAAFEVIDAATDAEYEDALAPLLDQPDAQQCMTMARLTFQQCVAASAFRFEDPFCIAEHGVQDVGDCVSKVLASAAPSTDGGPAAQSGEGE